MKRSLLVLLALAALAAFLPACEMHSAADTASDHGSEDAHH